MMTNMITDTNALDQYYDVLGADAPSFLLDIINTFLEDAPVQLAKLVQGTADNDAPSFQRAAHTLKSSLKVVGAGKIADLCYLLEEKGSSGDLRDVESVLADLTRDLDLLYEELRSKKGQL